MATIAENVQRVEARIQAAAARSGRSAASIRLVAVAKTVEPERIRAALAAGVQEIGENYLQEALPKFAELRGHSFIRHFIGHLQRNKAGRAAETFDVIQSLDSEPLARAVGRRAQAAGRTVEALIEVNVAGEASKSGVAPGSALALAEVVAPIPGIRLAGFMGIGPLGTDEAETRRAFRTLAGLFAQLPATHRQVLSLGMSGDFEIAIEEGSTMVRIGTGIFGLRSTHQ
jgi:PLP dependent protein